MKKVHDSLDLGGPGDTAAAIGPQKVFFSVSQAKMSKRLYCHKQFRNHRSKKVNDRL